MEPGYIYHEKQVAGLCGVHCLNTLLQGSYFTEVDLANIALEMDRREKQLMMEMGTDTADFLKFMAEDSGNVADNGDYSIQVLQKALADGWDLKCIPVTSPEGRDALGNPLKEDAFICNLSDHWFTIRKIGKKWYNLNSLLDNPQELSYFYLSLYIETLMSSGWSVFVVRGQLPPVNPNTITSEGARWVPESLCVPQKSNEGQSKAQRKPQTEEEELEAAIAMSLSGTPQSSHSNLPNDDFDADLQAALEASELEAAIEASLRKS
jgi:ataxin-3